MARNHGTPGEKELAALRVLQAVKRLRRGWDEAGRPTPGPLTPEQQIAWDAVLGPEPPAGGPDKATLFQVMGILQQTLDRTLKAKEQEAARPAPLTEQDLALLGRLLAVTPVEEQAATEARFREERESLRRARARVADPDVVRSLERQYGPHFIAQKVAPPPARDIYQERLRAAMETRVHGQAVKGAPRDGTSPGEQGKPGPDASTTPDSSDVEQEGEDDLKGGYLKDIAKYLVQADGEVRTAEIIEAVKPKNRSSVDSGLGKLKKLGYAKQGRIKGRVIATEKLRGRLPEHGGSTRST